MTPAYRDAMNSADYAAAHLEGILHAMDILADKYDGLNCPHPDANAITTLLQLARAKLRELEAHRKEEWLALGGKA